MDYAIGNMEKWRSLIQHITSSLNARLLAKYMYAVLNNWPSSFNDALNPKSIKPVCVISGGVRWCMCTLVNQPIPSNPSVLTNHMTHWHIIQQSHHNSTRTLHNSSDFHDSHYKNGNGWTTPISQHPRSKGGASGTKFSFCRGYLYWFYSTSTKRLII